MKSCLFLCGCFLLACLPNQLFAIEYAHDMPNASPTYDVLGTGPYEQDKIEIGTAQSGIYYDTVHTTYGPTTAPGESSGICDSATIGTASVAKYNLACNLLYALFGLSANYSSENITIISEKFETCCQGSGCTVPKKYILTAYSYVQRGIQTRGRVKVNSAGELDRFGSWSNFKVVTPCETAYCTLRTRTGFASSSSNLAGTYDATLRTGAPACP